MEEKDILCPDCGIKYVSKRLFEQNGKCTSCKQRESMAKSHNKEYVKFVDLSKEEKEKILKIRQNSNCWQKSKRAVENATGVKKLPKKRKKKKAFSLSRPKIMKQIREMSDENTTIREVFEQLCEIYPKENITITNLRNLYYRSGFPYKKTRKSKNDSVDIKDIETNLDDIDIEEMVIMPDDDNTLELENDSVDYDEIADDVDNEIDVDDEKTGTNKETKTITNSVNISIDDNKIFLEELPKRFEPIKNEVRQIITKKFRRLNCYTSRTYNTDDYINILEILLYLKENQDDILKARRSQHNIMNAYQQDTIHEAENTIAGDGDTYISDKLHVIRNYRRYFEMDYRDVEFLKPIVDLMDKDTLQKALYKLQLNKKLINEPVFKPLVDSTMIQKYEWAKSIDLFSAKANIDITTYGIPAKQKLKAIKEPKKSIEKPVLKKFRVSCQVSGGGFGAFTQWYRDYLCTSSSIALAYATNTLNQLKQTRSGMMWTEPEVTELDVKYNTGNKVEIIDTHIDKLLDDMRKNELNTVTIPRTNGDKKYLISCHIESKKAKAKGTWNKIYICDDLNQAKEYAKEELKRLKEYITDMYMSELDAAEIG